MNTKLIRRLMVLAVLVGCLGWFSSLDNASRTAQAASMCCSECPYGGNPNNLANHCANICGARSGSCYDNCFAEDYGCYVSCTYCGGSQGCLPGKIGEDFCVFLGFTGCDNGYCY